MFNIGEKLEDRMNRICKLFKINYPIIQAGMIWCSGWKLASTVSNNGGLGIIGSGSMHVDVLREHIRKCQDATGNSFAINVPLLYPEIDRIMKVIIETGVKYVFTSAGNPTTWTPVLKSEGISVTHVVSSKKFALKAEDAGVDAVVAEGFEAGGHNGREETTTMCLIPMVADAVSIPVIAAGGIGSGRAMAAAFALGAEGVQVGSRFATCEESSAHINFKTRVINATEGETVLTMKDLTPVRLIKNDFYKDILDSEQAGATKEEIINILGKRRAKKGIFEGDLEQGELEIGQISANIQSIQSAKEILEDIWQEFQITSKKLYDTEN